MDLSHSDGFLSRQHSNQWCPLITQQFRFRHVNQITGLNFPPQGSYYYTLHATAMSAPFYTSAAVPGPNPKWPELEHRTLPHQGATAMVVRIWSESLLQTWGINFSGLICLGMKPAEFQPSSFTSATLIFNAGGVYFTCIRNISGKPPKACNVSDTGAIYRKIAMHVPKSEVRESCHLDKLRKLQSLQLTLKNRTLEVEALRDKILHIDDTECEPERPLGGDTNIANVRYAPKLLTMKSVNRMLEEKPTKLQRLEIARLKKEIEKEQFTNKLLSSEKDRKTAQMRKRKGQLKNLVDANEEISTSLMSRYHQLSKDTEKLKDLKVSLAQNHELFSAIYKQLVHRRRQLLKEILFIYPICQQSEKKWTIHGVYLPNSDILTDCSDGGIAVALGYITHVILMSASFLQVPLRYPMTHCGSRSYVTDQVTNGLSDRDRDFPLFTRGKERIHFTYAVYLLNKNIAHLRCCSHMNTPDLKATLPNVASFLDPGDIKEAAFLPLWTSLASLDVDLHQLNKRKMEFSFARQPKSYYRDSSNESGPGLSEILSIPEAFMNKLISRETFTSYATSKQRSRTIKDGYDPNETIEQGTDLLDPNLDLSNILDSKDNNTKTAEILEQLMENGSSQDERELMAKNERCESAPLTVRTDALLNTNSFNLVRPKSSL